MGTIGLMGFTLNMMIVLLPPLLICVGIGDSVHFIAEYQDQCDKGLARRKAMLKTFAMVGLPCLLTTLTTMGAFLSFLTVRIRPFRELGVYASVGVVTAIVLTYVLVPFFYSFGMKKNALITNPGDQKNRHDLFDRLLARVHWIVTGKPGWIAAFFVVLALVSIAGALNVQVESNTAKMLSKKLPLRQAYDFVDERMGGSMPMEIMLDTRKTDGVKALNDKLGEGTRNSFIAVLFAVAALMMIFLRSVKLGLISMIPNVFPVLITLGYMGFARIYLDMPLMCCSAVIIGVAVDDTIHFFRRYRREFKALSDYT
jgi:predicted RND superfamily exporter protein